MDEIEQTQQESSPSTTVEGKSKTASAIKTILGILTGLILVL